MRSYVLASLVLHFVFLATGNWMASQAAREVPTFDTISVDLATLPPPIPEPEPEPEPEPPAEMDPAPPELEPEPAPPTPKEPEPDLVPPSPDLPEAPEEPEPEPEVEDPPPEALPEPEPVEPEPVETPAEREPEPNTPERAGEEQVAEDATVDVAAPEGVDDYYLALIRRKIGRRWEPSRAAARGRTVECVVSFHLGPAGDILNATVSQSSGLTVFDRAALRAVMSSSPLPKPPPRYPAGFPLEFIFVYKP